MQMPTRQGVKCVFRRVSLPCQRIISGELNPSMVVKCCLELTYEWAMRDSNPRHPACKAGALTAARVAGSPSSTAGDHTAQEGPQPRDRPNHLCRDFQNPGARPRVASVIEALSPGPKPFNPPGTRRDFRLTHGQDMISFLEDWQAPHSSTGSDDMRPADHKSAFWRRIPRNDSAPRAVNGHENPFVRTGLTLTEVLIVLALAATVALILLMAIPRAGEQARVAGCRRNLGQIGTALALYDQFQNHLPIVDQPAALDGQAAAPEAGANASPLRTLLETLGLPDFTELSDPKKAPQPRPGEVPGETAVPGFVCQSDPGGAGPPVSGSRKLSRGHRRLARREQRSFRTRTLAVSLGDRSRRRPELHGGVCRTARRRS